MLPPPEAPVLWLPQVDTSVVVLADTAAEFGDNLGSAPLIGRGDLARDSIDVAFRFALGNGQALQVLDCSTSVDRVAVAIIPLSLDGFDRIEAVERLLAALHGRAIPPDTRMTRQQRARLRRMLRAFDGSRAGATQQEIAQVILNSGPLDRDEWQAASARHSVKALLRDARSMIAGGYRKLLRHRRPN
ncbi:DUF2285 domain-containing protein [Celeribacter indicus]|uniref:T6SS Transcription factor RovC-like DNA binding domain-containing protein n=1 Tax=Celeribacter indicus TaxID=1208324 RepID=A0A0B5DY97_9RHOB|nr:DUF2285 domain-containing protein [Celeribacter indicus]AJE45686.1 hypothetical protein P73_0971 [Celeribacter indicus]